MGHASLLTTGGYDRRPELARLAAVERLHFPYPGPAIDEPGSGARMRHGETPA
jgi:hypothetical protein